MRAAFGVLALLISATAGAQSAPTDSAAAVDAIFAGWTNAATPGCAVGVARNGKPVLSRAYGMSNLEYDVPNTPATIFEAGSVSKQFTAAAVVLLMLDGKLSLEDPIRKYFPELPPYGDSITIRQMLNHISGFRDWGTVVAAAGWPRGSRTYTHTHVLDVIAKQKSLNYTPGAEYLYSNTNYNLAAMLVERVSGMSFPEFTKTRLFQPLGMHNTSWRDDYTRIVKRRSTAYSGAPGGWRQDMPFENVFGNSSLLTTVEDLIKWNQNFVTPLVGAGRLGTEMQKQGRLNSGRTITYALGLVVEPYRGVPEVNHTGATAGYRAYLGRFPDQKLDVALLCNMGSVNPDLIGHRVAEVFLQGQLKPAATQASSTIRVSTEALQSRVGTYRQSLTGQPLRITVRDSALRLGNATLVPLSTSTFSIAPSGRVEFDDNKRIVRLVPADGDTIVWVREADWSPSANELSQYEGKYASDEAEASFTIAVKDGRLISSDRYGRALALTPVYKDAFTQPGGTLVTFRRDRNGAVVAASLGLGRVRDLRFEKGK